MSTRTLAPSGWPRQRRRLLQRSKRWNAPARQEPSAAEGEEAAVYCVAALATDTGGTNPLPNHQGTIAFT